MVYIFAKRKHITIDYKYKLFIAICVLCEISFIAYHLSDDPLFISLIKFAIICCIIFPFLRNSSHRSFMEFEGMFKNTYQSSPEYRYFTEMQSYHQYKKYKATDCGICLEEFKFDEINNKRPDSILQLLLCGHLFHKFCLEANERHSWNNRELHIRAPYGKCPLCRNKYHTMRQKFEFNPNYWQRIHPLHQSWPIYNSLTHLSCL